MMCLSSTTSLKTTFPLYTFPFTCSSHMSVQSFSVCYFFVVPTSLFLVTRCLCAAFGLGLLSLAM